MSTVINIIDCEATCNHGHSMENAEVIEFGISVVDYKHFEIIKTSSIIVKPTTQSISNYCENLTGITQKQVDIDGITFSEACEILHKEYASTNRIWGSWGNFDKFVITDQCCREEVPYPFGHVTHLNIKTLFRIFKGLNKEVDMAKALDMLNLYHIGKHHSGELDSYNISCIFLDILRHIRY